MEYVPAQRSANVERVVPESGGFDLVSGFAFFVEAAAPTNQNPKHEILNPKQYRMTKIPMTKRASSFEFRYWDLFRA